MTYLHRTAEGALRRASRTFPAAIVTGPRQSGKTTLLKHLFGRTHRFVSLEEPDVRERVWQQSWDLGVIDEAHKCSAYTKRRTGRADDVDRTKRYQLAEKLTASADHVVLATATPHHGDDDRFGHFLRLLDPDVFPEPHRYGERSREIRQSVLSLGPDSPWAIRRLKENLRDVDGRRLFPDRHTQTVTFHRYSGC